MYEVTNPNCIDIIDIYDFVLAPLYILVILFIALNYQRKKEKENPEYRYFTLGLFAKIIGGIAFLLIYIYYYPSPDGDTTMYYNTSINFINMASININVFFSVLFGNNSLENYSYFNSQTGFPYFYSDTNSYAVSCLTVPFVFLGARSFMASTVLVSTLTYFGVWRIFLLFAEQNKEIVKQIAFAILFVPSVFFWGSGILKDSYTLSAICWLMVSIYYVIIKKRKIAFHVFAIIISIFILISLKPYIFFAAFGGIIIMIVHHFIRDVKNIVLKYTVLPMLIIVLIFGGVYIMLNIGSSIGGWYSSVDKVVEKAYITQQDLKQEYYGGNSFDIGKFEPTIGGILTKAQPAITAGIFRPYVWESRNPVMFISGLENFIYLFLFFYVVLLSFMALFNLGIKYMLKTAFDNSLVVFSIVFSILFAFMVGLTTANFGALVRYKIPLIPFFLSALFIIISRFNKQKIKKISN